MSMCTQEHAHTLTSQLYLKLRESTESPHASSCLLSSPLVREGERADLAAAHPEAWEEAGPTPDPKLPAQCGVVDAEGLTSRLQLLGLLHVRAEGRNLIWVLP